LTHFPEKLAEHQGDLTWYKAELERANKELAMANTALCALAKSIEMTREDLLNKTALTISSQIMPLIGDIANDKLPEKSKVKLDVLAAYLRNMPEGVSSTQDAIPSLSYMEMQVAILVTKGFSSEKIARLLNRSIFTVKTHRRSIRKKVGILKSVADLSTVLKQLLTERSRSTNQAFIVITGRISDAPPYRNFHTFVLSHFLPRRQVKEAERNRGGR
jgi:DNA-binding CsgD family transcriptional regulator